MTASNLGAARTTSRQTASSRGAGSGLRRPASLYAKLNSSTGCPAACNPAATSRCSGCFRLVPAPCASTTPRAPRAPAPRTRHRSADTAATPCGSRSGIWTSSDTRLRTAPRVVDGTTGDASPARRPRTPRRRCGVPSAGWQYGRVGGGVPGALPGAALGLAAGVAGLAGPGGVRRADVRAGLGGGALGPGGAGRCDRGDGGGAVRGAAVAGARGAARPRGRPLPGGDGGGGGGHGRAGAPGDTFSEASSADLYLQQRGVPPEALRLETGGRTSYESLAATARFLTAEGRRDVILISDGWHLRRSAEIANATGAHGRIPRRRRTAPTPPAARSSRCCGRPWRSPSAG